MAPTRPDRLVRMLFAVTGAFTLGVVTVVQLAETWSDVAAGPGAVDPLLVIALLAVLVLNPFAALGLGLLVESPEDLRLLARQALASPRLADRRLVKRHLPF